MTQLPSDADSLPSPHVPSPIPLILLAAGGSTRMGAPKQLLGYGGRSLLRQAVETGLASVCRPIVVVLGAHADALRSELNGQAVHIVENPNWQEGMSSSLRVGITAVLSGQTNDSRIEQTVDEGRGRHEGLPESICLLGTPCLPGSQLPGQKTEEETPSAINHQPPPITSSLVFMLCDQPFVTPELLNTLVQTGQETGKPIVACAYSGSVGVPALFDRTLFGELLALEGAAGAKQILARHAHNVVAVPFALGAIDVDTPDDYARLENNTPA